MNADISNARTKEKVLSILAAREIPDGGGNIVIKIKRNNRYFWWTISKYNSRETEGNIILQSKSYASETIYNIDDFKILFKDTLVLFDTLTIPLFVQDAGYPDTAYYITYNCTDGRPFSRKIPLDNWKLIFSIDLFSDCPTNSHDIVIRNNSSPQKIISECQLVFLNEEQRDLLLDIGQSYKNAELGIGNKEVAFFIQKYTQGFLGNLFFPQLASWLNKNLTENR